jgi:hypothetical protein
MKGTLVWRMYKGKSLMRSAGHVFDTPDLERDSKNAWRFTLRLRVLAAVIQTVWSHSFLIYLT